MRLLVEQAIVALTPLLITALTALVGVGVRWIQTKTKNEKVAAMEERLGDSVMTIVKSLSNTMVSGMKAASADGKITDEEREKVKAAAFAELQAYWGKKGIEEVKRVLGYASDEDFKASVAHDVEAAVFNMKTEQKAVAAAAPVVTLPISK